MKEKLLFRLGDFFVIAIILGISIAFFIKIYSSNTIKQEIIIKSSKNTWIYPLSENRAITAEGNLGETKIVVENSFVYFIDSPCTNKTCIASGKINNSNQWIACLPNQIFAYIKGNKNQEDFDLISIH
ncbi:MAG: NusG domain II-containing protein [Treponemataceae bacterium]